MWSGNYWHLLRVAEEKKIKGADLGGPGPVQGSAAVHGVLGLELRWVCSQDGLRTPGQEKGMVQETDIRKKAWNSQECWMPMCRCVEVERYFLSLSPVLLTLSGCASWRRGWGNSCLQECHTWRRLQARP